MSTPRPTLDMVLTTPQAAAALDRDTLAQLLAEAAAVQSTLTARLLQAAPVAAANGAGAAHVDDELLTVRQAAGLLRREPRWIWRHKRLPFVRQISSRSLLISRRELEKWLASRRVKS
jgi:hypothetical protein